jgi:hypothetical protein
MTRDQIIEVITQLVGDLEARVEERIDRAVAAKPVPPFVAPAVWTPGRHGACTMVRHRNGVFCARRDTDGEPGRDDAWLPLVVGIAAVDEHWDDDRTQSTRTELSDGTTIETVRRFAVPIVRGIWDAEFYYAPGDRVIRFGEWHATAPSKGIDPSTSEGQACWLKVAGKGMRALAFTLDRDGTMFESGHEIGSLKPMVAELFARLTGKEITP